MLNAPWLEPGFRPGAQGCAPPATAAAAAAPARLDDEGRTTWMRGTGGALVRSAGLAGAEEEFSEVGESGALAGGESGASIFTRVLSPTLGGYSRGRDCAGAPGRSRALVVCLFAIQPGGAGGGGGMMMRVALDRLVGPERPTSW